MKTSFPVEKIKVVLLENIHQSAVAAFKEAGFHVEHFDRALQGDELIEHAGDAHIIGIRSKSKVDAAYLQQAKRLLGIGCFCIGTNQVDLQAASERAVPVFNAPFSNTRSVAELVIAEVVALHRRLGDRSAAMHRGDWRKSANRSHEIRGRTLGIIGYGRIGSQVSVLAEAMGMRVLYYDIVDVLPLGNAEAATGLDDILRRADVITLHVPATQQTKNMIGARELSIMREGSFLLNNARGHVVEINALVDHLQRKHIAGAAIDVFPEEPASNIDTFDSPLRGLENVILTPHIGGSTMEAQRNIAESASSRLIRLVNNGTTMTSVNVPQVQLPRLHGDHHRLIYFHENVPGVLSKLHSEIAGLGINIAAEYLQSSPELAYLILDIAASEQEELLRQKIRAFPETVRVRFLW